MIRSRVAAPVHVGPRPVRVRLAISTRAAAVVAVAAAAVFAASARVAHGGDVPELEADVLRAVNGWPDRLEWLFWLVQQVGVLGAPAVGGLLLAWWGRRPAYALPFVALIPIKLGIEWLVIKQLIDRGRPFATIGSEIQVRGTALDGAGFPSGHATTAMAFAVLVMAFLPARWRPIPAIWAVLVGVARLYSGEHNTLDVVGGLALGTIYGIVLWRVALDPLVRSSERPS